MSKDKLINALLSEAWCYEWASCITCDGPQNFKLKFDVEPPPEWAVKAGQARNVVHLQAAPVQPVAMPGGDLQTALAVFDMGLGFALCHRYFGDTRNAVKTLQSDFSAIRAMLAAPAAQGDAKDAERLDWLVSQHGSGYQIGGTKEMGWFYVSPSSGSCSKLFDTARDAIDAAIAAKAAS